MEDYESRVQPFVPNTCDNGICDVGGQRCKAGEVIQDSQTVPE